MLVMADREMADAELLSYREDLENQDCFTQMDDLQVRVKNKKNILSHLCMLTELKNMGLICTRNDVQCNTATETNTGCMHVKNRDTL